MIALALLLTAALGWTVAGWILSGRCGPGVRLLRLGAAFPLGAMLLGNLLWLAGHGSLDVRVPAVFLLAVLVVLAAAALRWARRRVREPRAGPGRAAVDREERRMQALALGLLGAAAAGVLIHATSLPILGWDAWNAWLARAKAWHHAGAFLPVLPVEAWLASAPGSAVSAVASHYPEALSRFVAALAWWHGAWSDTVVALPWPLLWVSLGLLLAGALRADGLGPGRALLAAALLLTLPPVLAHASLAGYMDLWLATCILLAWVFAADHLRRRRPAALAGAVLVAALLPTIKLEGAIYAALLALALGFALLGARGRRWVLGVAAVVVPVALWLGVRVPLPGMGWVALRHDRVEVPHLGVLDLHWRGVGGSIAEALFYLPNWSLLWFLIVPVLVVGRQELRRDELLGAAAFLLLVAGFHFVLFGFTDAAAWAENLTSLNRLVLHGVPLWCWLLARLLSPEPTPYGRFARWPRPPG
ncbi:MAG: hypothetical protein KatS3mg126_0997 [Lysobacteraceae bacterium]|nr:MAG: hypothetical protein KatS3mg126_0997 [Xanthomonadaceae bacterium]